MTELVTYHSQPELKAAFLVEIGKHEIADQITKGTYGQMNGQWHGCAIGCSLRSLNLLSGKPHDRNTGQHDRIPKELGWPLWLAYAEDNIFENLPDELAKTWPRRLAEAIPVGVTVPDLVLAKMLRWMLIGDRFGVVHAADDETVKNIVSRMGALFDRTIAGEVVLKTEWNEAARAAWAAWAAWDAFYPAMSEELLRLLRELEPAKVGGRLMFRTLSVWWAWLGRQHVVLRWPQLRRVSEDWIAEGNVRRW